MPDLLDRMALGGRPQQGDLLDRMAGGVGIDNQYKPLPTPGLMGQIGQGLSSVGQAFSPQNLKTGFEQLSGYSPAMLVRQPQSEPEAIQYSALQQLNPVNAVAALTGTKLATSVAPLAKPLLATLMGYFTQQMTEGGAQAAGRRFSGVPQTPVEKGQQDVAMAFGAVPFLGAATAPFAMRAPMGKPSVSPSAFDTTTRSLQNEQGKALWEQANKPPSSTVVAPSPSVPTTAFHNVAEKVTTASKPATTAVDISGYTQAGIDNIRAIKPELRNEGHNEVLVEWDKQHPATTPPTTVAPLTYEQLHGAIHDTYVPAHNNLQLRVTQDKSLTPEVKQGLFNQLRDNNFVLRSKGDVAGQSDIDEALNGLKQIEQQYKGAQNEQGQEGQGSEGINQGLPKGGTAQPAQSGVQEKVSVDDGRGLRQPLQGVQQGVAGRVGGEAGSLFPKGNEGKPTGQPKKTIGEIREQVEQGGLVKAVTDKLSPRLSTGKDIVNTLLDSDRWKARVASAQGYDFPRTHVINPQLANAMAVYANSDTIARYKAAPTLTQVFGDRVQDEQFMRQFGGLMYEDMRKGAGGKGNPVWELRNSPFESEAQYKAVANNPEFKKYVEPWKEFIQNPAEAMHKQLGGKLATKGEQTGLFANLIAVLEKPTVPSYGNLTKGPLATLRQGSVHSMERKFSGVEYNLNAADMATEMLKGNLVRANKEKFYNTLEKTGQGKILNPGDPIPVGMTVLENPIRRRTLLIVEDGKSKRVEVSQRLALNPKIEPEVRQAFQLNTNVKDWLAKHSPELTLASQTAVQVQVKLGIDLAIHTMNDYLATLLSPKSLAKSDMVTRIFNNTRDQHRARTETLINTPEVQAELLKMAEAGVSFRGSSMGGWSSERLRLRDTATRLVLNREYDDLVKKGSVEDTPAERRRYISGRAGQYNKRFMTWFEQSMQETGAGSFNVAGRNFNRLAVGNLIGSPGVKATSATEALRLRLSVALGIATAALTLPWIVNTATSGSPTGPPGTPVGDIYLYKKKDGTPVYLDMKKMTLLERGGRASGVGAVMEGQVMPAIRGEEREPWAHTLRHAVGDVARTAVSPFIGPSINVASATAFGQTPLGYGKTDEKGFPYVKAGLSTLNPLIGPSAAASVDYMQGRTPSAKGMFESGIKRLGQIAGVREGNDVSMVRQWVRSFKEKRGINEPDNFAPSEYKPLEQSLMEGKTDDAKVAYEQLVNDRKRQHIYGPDAEGEARKTVQAVFTKMLNPHFDSKEAEGAFKKTLSPEQQVVYDRAVKREQDLAAKFFELFPKEGGKTWPPPLRLRHFANHL